MISDAVHRTLNRIQSRIYPTALNSNQNLLVCAPTGAGKTNIAMLAVLHEVGQNMRHGIIQKQDFKVVYVAPMKALAAEVTAAFSRRLGPLGESAHEIPTHSLLLYLLRWPCVYNVYIMLMEYLPSMWAGIPCT